MVGFLTHFGRITRVHQQYRGSSLHIVNEHGHMVTMGPQHPRRNSVARKAKELMKLGVQVEIETPTRVKTYSGAKYFQDIHPV